MTEKEIISIFEKEKQCEIELNILAECSENTSNSVLMDNSRYVFLKKRAALMRNWINLISKDEYVVLRLHLIEGNSWSVICSMYIAGDEEFISDHPRTLQRIQKRAIRKITAFMDGSFGSSMDFLARDPTFIG